MPFYERGPVRIHYEEVGSGFPLLLLPAGAVSEDSGSLTMEDRWLIG